MTTTTAVFSIQRGKGRILLNNVDIVFGNEVTLTDQDSLIITRKSPNFTFSIQNTGSERLALSRATIAASGFFGGITEKSDAFTLLVGTGGGSFDFLIPEGRWEDMVTGDVIENILFFTYNGSTLVDTTIRSPIVFALDTSTATFRFVIIYYDLDTNQLKGLPYSYNSETGVFTYGSVTVMGSTGDLTNCTQLTFQRYNYFIDAILTDSTHFLVNYYAEGVAGAVILRCALFSFSGITITPIGSELTIVSTLYVSAEDPVRPRQTTYPQLKQLTAGRTVCVYHNATGNTRHVVLINTSGDTYTLSNVVDITSTYNEFLMGIEVIDSTHIAIQAFGNDGVDFYFYGSVFTVNTYTPLALTASSNQALIPYDFVSDPGYGQIIKLANGNFVFFTGFGQDPAPNTLTLATYSAPNFSYPTQVNITNYITLKPSTGNLFLTYRFYESDEVMTRYDTTGDTLASSTTLSLTFANMVPVNFLTFDTRFITCNIYDDTRYATFSGTITPFEKLTDYKPVYLQIDADPVVPIVSGNTMTVGLLPNVVYYSHTNGEINDIGFNIPTLIDDHYVEIGTTDATGTILTFD